MIKWKKPSGTVIETNDAEATLEAARSLGWVEMEQVNEVPLEEEPVVVKPAKKAK